MQQLLEADKYLFRLINSTWHHPIMDEMLPLFRIKYYWLPLYLFLALFILINFKKNGWLWILFAAGTAALTDFVSSSIIKENIMRLRPCNDPDMASNIRVLVSYRPISSSFTSSHAANHFGTATFIFFTLRQQIGHWAWAFFAWAFIIIYAQVYVGVHYPIDVVCGAMVGFLFGYLSAKSFNKNYSLAQ